LLIFRVNIFVISYKNILMKEDRNIQGIRTEIEKSDQKIKRYEKFRTYLGIAALIIFCLKIYQSYS